LELPRVIARKSSGAFLALVLLWLPLRGAGVVILEFGYASFKVL
jgi:hypothetical protein